MKTDLELQREISEAIAWEPGVDASRITAVVTKGIVQLTGTVPSYRSKMAAEKAARGVHSVQGVANELTVKLDQAVQPTDPQLTEAVTNMLAWDSAIPLNAIDVRVHDGWVTLSGAVEWQYQKSAAQIAAERTWGVRGVDNQVAIEPRISIAQPADVRTKITDAFKRGAQIDADAVGIDVKQNTVTLSGVVRSLGEREQAEQAAWATPGVRHVENNLAVRHF